VDRHEDRSLLDDQHNTDPPPLLAARSPVQSCFEYVRPYEVDRSSIATSMDDQLSTNPDDCDRQRRPGLSVLIHQCSRDRGFMAWLHHGCRILRIYLSIILHTRGFEKSEYFTSIFESGIHIVVAQNLPLYGQK
jgi:hypothetical protein